MHPFIFLFSLQYFFLYICIWCLVLERFICWCIRFSFRFYVLHWFVDSVSGDNEGAVRTLLATPVEAENFLLNGLKACLTASVRTPEHFMFAIKLVATNLVACGKLQDAVEILCFAGCFDDACRFLQVHDRWEAAASLGKATLDDESYRVLIDRWADILCEGQASEWVRDIRFFGW